MPLITLTSDIGQQDFLVGAVKGQLLQVNPNFNITDITHSLSPFNYPQAAYVCRNAIKNFPAQTFHIVIVNLFDHQPEHLLLVKHDNQYIGCADNGLITMILEELPPEIISLPLKTAAQKNTLSCVEVFAKAFNDIVSGKTLTEIGNQPSAIQIKNHLRPLTGNNWIEGDRKSVV